MPTELKVCYTNYSLFYISTVVEKLSGEYYENLGLNSGQSGLP